MMDQSRIDEMMQYLQDLLFKTDIPAGIHHITSEIALLRHDPEKYFQLLHEDRMRIEREHDEFFERLTATKNRLN